MRILHIATQAPGYKSGGEIGTLQFSYAMTQISDDTDYVGPQISEIEVASWYHQKYYIDRPITKIEKAWTISHLYFDRHYLGWKRLKIDFNKYHIIFVEFTKMDYFIKDIIRSGYQGVIVVRAHNVERDFYRVNLESKKTIINKIKFLVSEKREGYMVSHSDLVLAITEDDKKRLFELYDIDPKTICICPVGVNLPKQNTIFTGKIGIKLKCLITGSLWFGPNAEATKWFLNEVYSKISDICELTIAGFHPNNDLKDLCVEKNVYLVDSPDSMEPYFMEADMVLAPIFDGGGMKVKVAEAMSYGLPVVTTSHGNIGYDLVNLENGFIANTPDEFAKAIRFYYEMTEKQRCKFLNRAWKTYCEKFSLTAIKVFCEKTFQELIN